MNKVVTVKHLRAIADLYAAADNLAAAFWQSPDGIATLKVHSTAWFELDQPKRYAKLADDVECLENPQD